MSAPIANGGGRGQPPRPGLNHQLNQEHSLTCERLANCGMEAYYFPSSRGGKCYCWHGSRRWKIAGPVNNGFNGRLSIRLVGGTPTATGPGSAVWSGATP